MAMGDAYITGTQLGQYMGIDLTKTDAIRDQELTSAVAAASKAIREACGRDFNKETTATPRKFKPYGPRLVIVDDFYTTDGLVIQTGRINVPYGDPWGSTDYELGPFNNVVNGVPDRPYTSISLPYFHWLWDIDRVQVTAKWGWAAIPDNVIQATKILGAEYYKLRTAPFGVAEFGSGPSGSEAIKVQDVPQAWSLVCGYERSEKKVYLG